MSSKISFARTQYAWVSLIPRLGLFAVLCFAFYHLEPKSSFFCAALVYFFLYYSVNTIIPLSHRAGVALIKKGNFKEAIVKFQQSGDFFTKYAWIDKYRYLVLLLSSKRTMWEISRCNEAWCLMQIKKLNEAITIYEEVLKKYPENAVANSALMTINSVLEYKKSAID